jgi:16S rRNA (guanine966-N2)-methyltransferase
MRVIAGEARGLPLEAPKGLHIRPTLDRVREALFSILGPRLQGARFLDLFAGTGANGIEAISRGAAWALFADNSAIALRTVVANLKRTRLARRASCQRMTIPGGLAALQVEAPFDIIFADPPYEFRDFEALLNPIRHRELLAPGGIIVLEHAASTDVPNDVLGFSRTRQRGYGDTALSFFE